MNLSLVSGAFLSVLFAGNTLVLCLVKADSYSDLAKAAFDSEPKDASLPKGKTVSFSYAKLAKEAYDNEAKNGWYPTGKTVSFSFAKLAKEAYDNEAKNEPFAAGSNSFAKLAKEAYDNEAKNEPFAAGSNSFAKLAKEAYDNEAKYEPEPQPYSTTDSYTSFFATDDTFKSLKFFTDEVHKRNLPLEPNRVDLRETRNLVPLKQSLYHVEREHGFTDFLFKPAAYVKRVTFNTDTVWKWDPFRVAHPTSMTLDPYEMEFTVRDNLRWFTYKRRANGTWQLVNHYLTSNGHEINDFEYPHNAFSGLSVYTLGSDNVVHLNDLQAFEVKRLGKFRSIYFIKFTPGTKCVGVENKGLKMWYRSDDVTPVNDDLTREYPTHVVFNVRGGTTFVMFKWSYAGYFSNGQPILFV